MDSTAEHLVSFASSLTFAVLEPQILHAIKQRFIDAIGCAVGGFSSEPAVISRRMASLVQSSVDAGILGTRTRSSPELASFANTAMIRCLDFNDDYFGKDGPHPSDTIGAVLSVADSVHANGRAFINGVVVAYETLCNLADAVGLRDLGWDYVTFTTVAAALGAGKVLGLSQEQLRHAVSLAIVPNCALGQTRLGELSMWKGLASANACRNGVFASLLAREGVTGPFNCFEGKNGVVSQVTGKLDLSMVGARPLKAGIVYLKSWPVFYTAQVSVQAALALREKVAVDEIQSVTIESYKRILGRGATDPEKWAPKSRETADHSLPFCIAVALLDGGITLKSFESKRFLDPDVVRLMSKIELREDPEFTKQYPEVWNCRMIAVTRSGKQQVHVAYPKGHPKNPLSDREVEEKFLSLSQPLLGVERCRAFLKIAWKLEELEDVGKLFELLAV